jgi:hypothetical protein
MMKRPDETSAVDVSGQHPVTQVTGDGPRQRRCNWIASRRIAVRNVIGREKVLIQLESLILAQSERWRQA